jgi:hypothetical protein
MSKFSRGTLFFKVRNVKFLLSELSETGGTSSCSKIKRNV